MPFSLATVNVHVHIYNLISLRVELNPRFCTPWYWNSLLKKYIISSTQDVQESSTIKVCYTLKSWLHLSFYLSPLVVALVCLGPGLGLKFVSHACSQKVGGGGGGGGKFHL